MIEFKAGRYVSQIWFLGGDKADFDVLAVVYRDAGEAAWHIVYRFRYYDGTDRGPFEDEDRKSWRHATTTSHDEEAVLSLASRIFRDLATRAQLDTHVVPVRTDDVTKILELLRQQTWAHFLSTGTPPRTEDT